MSTPRVMVGVSGGVDSSVAAWRLVQQGEAVAGLFMQNWADDGSGDCRAEDDRRDAVAEFLQHACVPLPDRTEADDNGID